MVFQIVSGPLAGNYWYWSEEIIPKVGVGHTVAAGQTIATFAPSGTGIELGWWALFAGRPLGGVEGYTEEHGTPAGADFRYLLEQLEANPGDGAGRSLPPTLGTTVYPGL
jgi:hypothetical protein